MQPKFLTRMSRTRLIERLSRTRLRKAGLSRFRLNGARDSKFRVNNNLNRIKEASGLSRASLSRIRDNGTGLRLKGNLECAYLMSRTRLNNVSISRDRDSIKKEKDSTDGSLSRRKDVESLKL